MKPQDFKQIYLRQGTEAEITDWVNRDGVRGEPFYETDTGVLDVHNGTEYLPVAAYESITSIDNSDSPYTVLSRDRNLRVDTSAGSVTINLPAATGSGRRLDIKIIDATNATTIDGNSSETIDGSTTLVLSSLYDNASLQDAASGEWDIK